MKRVVKITENDLAKIVRRVIRENRVNENLITNTFNKMFGKKLKKVFIDPNNQNSYAILSSGEKITSNENNLTFHGCNTTNGQEITPSDPCTASFNLDNFQYSCGRRDCIKD